MLGFLAGGNSKLGEGASRLIELRQHWSSWQAAGSAFGRSGVAVPFFDAGSNWGLGGTTSREKNNYGNIMAWRERGGCSGSSLWGVPLAINRTNFKPIAHGDIDLFVFEVMLAWVNNTLANADNGLQFCPVFAGRPRQAGVEGISIFNDAGTPRCLTRGSGGTETIDLSPFWPSGTPITQRFVTVRCEFRNCRLSRNASFRLVLDGNIAFQRDYSPGHKLPDGLAVPGGLQLFPTIGIYSAVDYIWYRDLAFYAGPDDDGVLPK